jgi:molecular chaperone GrpE
MQQELDAFRERQARILEERVQQRVAHILGPVLDVFDELKRAVRAAEQTENASALVEGMRAIVALFERRLQQCGITIIAPQNQPFDPSLHEAVEVVEVEPEREGLVLDVVEPGYRLGETTLIRPARVRVGRAPKDAAAESAPSAGGEGPRLESG